MDKDPRMSWNPRFSLGILDSVHFSPDPSVPQPLRYGEVQVSVKAASINLKDGMVLLNQVSDNHISQESAGLVTVVVQSLHGMAIASAVSSEGAYASALAQRAVRAQEIVGVPRYPSSRTPSLAEVLYTASITLFN